MATPRHRFSAGALSAWLGDSLFRKFFGSGGEAAGAVPALNVNIFHDLERIEELLGLLHENPASERSLRAFIVSCVYLCGLCNDLLRNATCPDKMYELLNLGSLVDKVSDILDIKFQERDSYKWAYLLFSYAGPMVQLGRQPQMAESKDKLKEKALEMGVTEVELENEYLAILKAGEDDGNSLCNQLNESLKLIDELKPNIEEDDNPQVLPAEPAPYGTYFKLKGFSAEDIFDVEHLDKHEELCPICKSAIMEGQSIKKLPCDCKSYYHAFCMEEHLERYDICPMCIGPISKHEKLNVQGQSSNEQLQGPDLEEQKEDEDQD